MSKTPMPLRFVVVVDSKGVYTATEFINVGFEPAVNNPTYTGSTEIQDLLNKQAGRIEQLEAALGKNSEEGRIY